jgi:hypothetical protein
VSIKKIDLYNSYLIIVTGVLQWIATPIFFKTLEEPSFWFFNGGITLVLLGFLNIVRIHYGTGIQFIWKFSLFANLLVFIFWVSMFYFLFYKFQRYPFAWIELIILALAFVLSLRKSKR